MLYVWDHGWRDSADGRGEDEVRFKMNRSDITGRGTSASVAFMGLWGMIEPRETDFQPEGSLLFGLPFLPLSVSKPFSLIFSSR